MENNKLEVFRIYDRFNISGRGPVYLLQDYFVKNLKQEDILYDLQGHRFKVKGIEHFACNTIGDYERHLPAGVLFEKMDGEEAEGFILLRKQPNLNFLYCNHPLYQCKVDEDYETEYNIAKREHSCALFSYEDLEAGQLSLYGDEISGLTIYRGWMMKPDMYRLFYQKLEEKGIILINSPEEYDRCHMLPGWYDEFKEYTPESVWEKNGSVESAVNVSKSLNGSYIVKDFVKSRKHEWYDACFIKDISDTKNTEKVIRNFVSRQGADLVGGVVLRKYEKLKKDGFHEKSGMPLSEEYRVFIFANTVMAIDNYWKSGKDVKFSEDEMLWIQHKVQKIRSNFATMDIARRENGELIIMEIGDGQVSGLQQIDTEMFYRHFNPLSLWLEDIRAVDLLPEGAVIMGADPMPTQSIDEMRKEIEAMTLTKDLVDAYVSIHNKFWYIEDEIYDYTEGTEEYQEANENIEAWGTLTDSLEKRILALAEQEGLLSEKVSNAGTVKRLELFMDKYGYRDGAGWWVKKTEE